MQYKTVLITSILITLMTLSAFGQVEGHASIEAGIVPESGTTIRVPYAVTNDYSNTIYVTMDVLFPILKYAFIEGSTTTLMGVYDGEGFLPAYGAPFATTYTVGAGVTVGIFTAGIVHECSHPVTPNAVSLLYPDGSYTKIYAKLEVTF